MTTIAVYAAGWILWPLTFRALAGRLLGIDLGRLRGLLSGLVGIATGYLGGRAVPRGAENFAVYILFAILGTLACVAALDFLVRPTTLGQLERSFISSPHPLRAIRRRLGRARRYVRVLRVATRHRLLSAFTSVQGSSPTRLAELGRDLSLALEEAGGMFVKLGQVLSTRADLLPGPLTDQLARLQDQAAPVQRREVETLLEAEYGRPITELFARFEWSPLAAASIGQVHRATRHDGREVVVKVQRPDVEEQVQRDLAIILELAGRIETTTGWGRRVGAADLARGFAGNLREELDYRIEAHNTATLAKLLRHHTRLRVPAVHEDLCTRRVLVLEWLDGVPLRDAGPRMQATTIDRSSLARELLAAFLEQVLELGIFNADPHPGNVLILADGTLGQIDFGSVGRLHAAQRLALARLLLAVDRSDPELLRGALLDLATTSAPVKVDALDRALGQFVAHRLGPGSRQGATVFADLLLLLTSFGLAFDPQLAGVFRALMTLEGTLKTLDPGFMMVEEVKALSAGVGRNMFGIGAFRDALSEDILKLGPILRTLPKRIDRIAAALERDELGINVRLLADERDTRFLTGLIDRVILTVISAAIALTSAVLITVSGGAAVSSGVTVPQVVGYIGLAVATVLGLRVLVAVTRDRLV
ncbi:MAG: ABC1 kinase family protein [Solirubrobacteraceae bacterium]